ncbi:neuraminidase-like domain-containing protein [Sorangium sp. So ce1153]|uniref:Tc toxin subunit A-related protein n=1 Tax=Sorangium sp. So ce1153 TaxID=3133333 RepID=UPI003F62CD1D
MPSLIILRLHPVEPIDGATFRDFLAALTIKAFDLSFGDSVTGVHIGTASGLADPHLPSTTDNSVDVNNTSILQHYVDFVPPGPPVPVRILEAAATAVIVVNAPAGHPEYPSGTSFDIRLEITRGGMGLVNQAFHYNVTITDVVALSSDQTSYFGMAVSAFIALPSSTVGLDPSLAYVDLPADGRPPRFDDLVKAIDLVLAKDPGGAGATLVEAPVLTPAQSRQVAAEIVWNRALYPPPEPPRSIGALYTMPPIDPSADKDKLERERKQFEAELAGYQTTHDVEALRLAGFVYAASAAIACEIMSKQASRAGLDVPIITGASTGAERAGARVILTQAGALNPSFVVPAAYFYALGAMMPMAVAPEQRYEMARLQREARVAGEIQASVDAGVIAMPAAPLTVMPATPGIQVAQAARRLRALGASQGSAAEITVAAPVTTLVTDWLAYAGSTSVIEASFWVPEAAAQPAAYLDLLLRVITDNHLVLMAAIKAPPHNVASVSDLVALTDEQWRRLFLGPPVQAALLPPFTEPGTPKERAEAFIRHLRKFFSVPAAPVPSTGADPTSPPTLDMSPGDVLAAFADAYLAHVGAQFTFGGALDGAVDQAIVDVFPADPEARAWLSQVLHTINDLFQMTSGIGAQELQFSLIEALFARGITGPQDLVGLSPEDFQDALAGTVGYAQAAAIYAKSGATPPPAAPGPGTFQPVNPGGSLVDCIPPEHLSPLGPVAYLAEMLCVTAASTCEAPFPQPGDERAPGLAALLESRRGSLGSLRATRANLVTPLPRIDLVNESLEALADGLPGAASGAVYDTAADVLAGHRLRGPGQVPPGVQEEPFLHDPQTLFAALPEHSSPAVPVERPGAYAKLEADFTAPLLPYPQALDINRSYLRALGSSRFVAMRTFREQITEFVLDPANEPAGFQRHLWRYPVRFPIALEFLQISLKEYELLYSQDIATTPAPGKLLLRELYGFPDDLVNGVPWTKIVTLVPEFLRRTGLTYCQLLDLWRSGFVSFVRKGPSREFPECLPCCPDNLEIDFIASLDPLVALRKLAVFIRLWRRLQEIEGSKLSFAQLRDIAEVLGLFKRDAIQPGFLRELAALLMLRDFLGLPLSEKAEAPAPGATGADRTHLLALWRGPAHAKWNWAIALLLERIDARAEAQNRSLRRAPELTKLIADNLAPLSRLAGFNPSLATDAWNARPSSTLRFVEVLTKIYASGFTAGQVLFLFTPEVHLAGDDPFRMADANEAREDPLDLPEDDELHHLWELRRKLLEVPRSDEAAEEWTWARIVQVYREELGFAATPSLPDPLIALGEHFFPSALERAGHPVSLKARQYRLPLAAAATSPLMWNTPPGGPFQYDPATEELWAQVPLRDDAVAKALQEMRALTPVEQAAVQSLYFAPRADLARLALVFGNFSEAVDRLTHEPDEAARWSYFRQEFARFYRRCRLVAQHLAAHVAAETGREHAEGDAVARKILRHLLADENLGKASWEHDAGAPPGVTWGPLPHGGAFAALLGVVGTGLLAEFRVKDTTVWRDVGGSLSAFGALRNQWNAPVPVIVPSLGLALTPEQLRFVVVRNGFALRDVNGEPLGGAEPFAVRWSGVLMVEKPGQYRFHAGAPNPDGEEPDFHAAKGLRWRLTLKRGQKKWILLNRRWQGEDAPDACSGALSLRRGAYEIVVELEQEDPTFATAEEICPQRAGFEVKYSGPDSDDRLVVIPHERLFRDLKTGTLSAGLRLSGAAAAYLDALYTSTLRDVRRTYQRAFKAVLFAHQFALSARPVPGGHLSELGYILDHGGVFLGTSHPRTGPATFGVHRAYLDFNLLPVTDPYHPPPSAEDQRQAPSAKRQSALYDWWERVHDYTVMRRETRAARERPAWLLFYEASERQPDDPPQLVRHLGVDIRHAPLVLSYHATPTSHTIQTPELEDERWALRVWQAEKWVRTLKKHFFPRWIGSARPALWASDDLAAVGGAPPESGNSNLTLFVRNGSFENGDPRRYDDVSVLNNGLRERARAALLSYLCGMSRVALPWGGHATAPRDLSDLLLQDVEVGVCQRASRIEEAISAVQKLVQRARLGLEPALVISSAFALLWDRHFASFRTWETCARRSVYRESWIVWDEIEKARRTEAFRFLQNELRRATLTVPAPGGLAYWPGGRPPAYPGLTLLQTREPAGIQILTPGPGPEGLDLLGTPERHARPAWLAPLFRMRRAPTPDEPGEGERPRDKRHDGDRQPPIRVVSAELAPQEGGSLVHATAAPLPVPLERLPLWIQAAVRLGTRFVRVAAAGTPPASTGFSPRRPDSKGGCCADCGRVHPPVVDEYYFWLQDARHFSPDDEIQNADQGVTSAGVLSDWHNPEKLPELLHWDSRPMVLLVWCRLHNGELKQPRRSHAGVRIDPALLASGGNSQLAFMGRTGDSLRFEVPGAVAPPGHHDPTPPGFRYDLATDSAVVLPLVAAPPAPPNGPFPGGLKVYPYFAYFAPGAPLLPLTMFAEAVAVAGTLRAHCRFEAALKWYGLVLDPLQRDMRWAQCPPNRQRPPEREPLHELLDEVPTSGIEGVEVPGRCEHDVPCCPSTPVSDALARSRAVTLDYLETLLQWGDALMCRNTPEAFQQATVIYDTLRRALGQRPLTIAARDDEAPMTLAQFHPRPAPLSPRLLSLYDRAADRLAHVHHCQNGRRLRSGRPSIDMPYFGNSGLRDGWQTEGSACEDESDWCLSCCSAYRFSFLVQKAIELANEVRGLGAALLSAYEKGDAEYLMSLRATHERQLLQLALGVRQDQWREADWQVQALQKTKEGAQARYRYYRTLIANGLNAGEIGYEMLIGVSIASRIAGNVVEAIAQGMGIAPDMWIGIAGIMGSPLQFNQLPIGSKLAGAFATAARILNAVADNASTGASLSLTEGGWERREEEWHHQVEVIGIEIEQIERQILAAERRRDAALRELDNHQRQIENAEEVQSFLRDKFTSHELYIFLQQETAALLRQSYELALHKARQAQQAFNHERGNTARIFLPSDAWDNLQEALLAGDKLLAAVRQMEKAYLDANCREYELTKHISLRQHFPASFLLLQMTGYCEIDIPEWMFDLDYPGHYMRRIKNVNVTVPCVTGPYTGVHCRLTLLSSVTRVDPRLTDPPARCCDDPGCSDGYHALPDDPRVRKAYAATEAIATSSGRNDSGLFELNFRDERYLPFELAGAVSRFRVELPPENNQWSLDTLGDFVLHLNYTAREGGEVLRHAANRYAQRHLPGAGVRLIDIRHELPDAWHAFQEASGREPLRRALSLRLTRAMFPFLSGRHNVRVRGFQLLFEGPGAKPSASHVVEFLVGRHGHSHGAGCDCERRFVTCVASSEWPELYHGSLQIESWSLNGDRAQELGVLQFPSAAGAIGRVFLLIDYQVA